MSTVTGNQSSNVSGTKYIDSRCIVDFRPNDDWKGEYGFDWFRIGDAKENIDGTITVSRYSEIVGKYDPQDPDYSDSGVLKRSMNNIDYVNKLANDEYPTFKILGFSNRTYLAPYISLYYMSKYQWEEGQMRTLPSAMVYKKDGRYYPHDFCKTEATVKAFINARNIDKIEFTCDKSLTVTPNVLRGIPDGRFDKTINIRLNYAFGEGHQSIKVFAYHKDGVTKTFAGQINVVRCEPKTVDVCFVNVKIQINKTISSGISGQAFSTTQQNNLKRFLSQAHVIPNITFKSLDLKQEQLGNHLSKKTWKDGKVKYKNVNVIKKFTYDEDSNITGYIGSNLENWFNEKYPSMTNTYKVFFLGEYGWRGSPTDDAWLGGHANGIPSKGLVIYKDPKEHFVSHEIMHCFGLYHSFSNRGKHTFSQFKTSNIMDYSPANTVSNKNSLWRWQWNVIRNAADVKKAL